MSMICPSCQKAFENRMHCPYCSVRLQYRPKRDAEGMEIMAPHWSRSTWGRVTLGMMMSLGLYLAIVQAERAFSIAWKGSHEALFLAGTWQLVAVLVGSVFVGTGDKRGVFLGGLVGVLNGIFYAVFQQLTGGTDAAMRALVQPLQCTALGALGGLIGSIFWRMSALPAPPVFSPRPEPTHRIIKRTTISEIKSKEVHWLRVIIGSAICIAGLIWSQSMSEWAFSAGSGRLTFETSTQEKLLPLGISAVAIFIGAAIAGAGTWNGALQGAWVGVFVSIAHMIHQSYGAAGANMTSISAMVSAILALSYLGGRFGSQVFPPLLPVAREQKSTG